MTERAVVKSYFAEEVSDTVSKARALQTEPCIIFPLCTDIHYLSANDSFERMIDNMRSVSEQVRCDGVACLGDMTDGDVSQSITTERLHHMFDRFRELRLPIMFAAGNHDANGYYSTPAEMWFTKEQIAQTQYSSNRNDAVFSDDTQNWYLDIPSKKVRILSLCSANTLNTSSRYGYPDGTDTFVANALNSTPSGYLVILLEHLSPISSQNWNSTHQFNSSSVLSAINTWLGADSNHQLISFMGHSHADYHFTEPWLNIAVHCQKTEPSITEDYTVTQEMKDQGKDAGVVGAKHWHMALGSVIEDCWDLVVIQLKSQKVNCIRFGAGEDREFNFGGAST